MNNGYYINFFVVHDGELIVGFGQYYSRRDPALNETHAIKRWNPSSQSWETFDDWQLRG